MTDKETLQSVLLIASKYSGLPISKLDENSSVNFDLRIDGDDIESFIMEIDKKFDLNFEGFNFSTYFNSESEINIITSIFRYFFKKNKLK